jgi:CheY-like chemotaxis protein
MTEAARPILVVEDDEDIREAVQDALERRGYQVLTAGDGRQALAALRGADPLPAVILLDLTMPVMSGWEFMAEQEKEPALAAVPVVVMSAVPNLHAQPDAIKWAGILTKPVALGILLETVARFFSRTSP